MKARGGPAGREMAPSGSSRIVSPARSAAFEILRRVEDDAAFASVLLAASDDEIRPDDRALCYELVMGVLRWQLWLDALIDHYAERKAESLDKPIRRALRMGLYELRFLSRIPHSATVNEAVNLAYLARVRSASGFVNAVLRRAIREENYDPAEQVDDPIVRLSVATSHPVWLIDRWVKALGIREAEDFARSNNEAPPVSFRVIDGSEEEQGVLMALSDAGASVSRSRIARSAWRVDGAATTVRKLAAEGRIYLQDEASQLVGLVLEAQACESILDVCAAPGSKTTHIAALAPESAFIIAGDLYEHRLRTVVETTSRVHAKRVSVLVHDAIVGLPFRDKSFDRVLVDAPCSGTGTLRRNPEIKWRISAQDIFDMAERQGRILANAARVVRTGGRLVYSTCSIEPDENEDVVLAFLQDHKDFTQVVVNVDGMLPSVDGSVRTWTHRDGTDGFFIAAFERRA
jgi:16S rRNA (cytosine967-C5)-methyltransferase